MAGGGKAAHVGSDLGQDGRRGPLLHTRDLGQLGDELTKGGEQSLHLRLEAGDPLGEHVDHGQVLTDQEGVVAREAAVEGGGQVLARRLQPAIGERRQSRRIGLASDQRLQNAPAVDAEQVGHDGCEFDVGVLQHLADTVLVLRHLALQLRARPRQIAQLPDRLRRHEARADQAVGQEIGQPAGIARIALAAGQIARLVGVDQHQRERGVQDVPHRLPIDTGCLHHDMRDTTLFEPSCEREKIARRGREAALLVGDLAASHGARADRHEGGMHIKTGALLM